MSVSVAMFIIIREAVCLKKFMKPSNIQGTIFLCLHTFSRKTSEIYVIYGLPGIYTPMLLKCWCYASFINDYERQRTCLMLQIKLLL